MLKILVGLTLLLLVACGSASIAPSEDLSRPTAVDVEAPNTGLVETAEAARSVAPAEAALQRTAEPVRPAVIPSVRNAEVELAPASPAPAGLNQLAGGTSSSDDSPGVQQSEPEITVAAKETASEVNSQPVPEPLQAPADGTEASSQDSSPKISLPPAPAFTLTSASGESVSLEDYRGEGKVVLIFFRGFW